MSEEISSQGQTRKIKKPFNPLFCLRQHLFLALIIAVFGSAGSVFIAHKKAKMTYSTEAVLNVEPSVPKILYRTEDTLRLRSYEDWMRTQVNIIESQPILEKAIIAYHNAGFVWRRPGDSMTLAIVRLAAKLKVKQMRDTQLIKLSMSSSKNEGLAEIINAVVKVFMDSKRSQQENEDTTKLKRLEVERKKIQSQLDASYQELERISNELGTAITEEKNLYVYIDAMFDLKRSQNQVYVERIRLTNKLESLKKKAENIKAFDIEPMVNEIVERNALLQDNRIQFHRREQDIRDQMVDLSRDNPQYQHHLNRLEELREQTKRLQRAIIAKENRILREKMVVENQIEIEELSSQYEAIVKTEKELDAKLKALQSDILEYNTAVLRASTSRQEIERLQASLNRINERIDQITLEWANPGRIHVIEMAIPPETGASNRMKLMIIGIAGSVVIGFGLAVGIGMLNPAIQRPDEIQKGLGFPPTGIVLDSKEDGIDPNQIYYVFKRHFLSYINDQYNKVAIHFDKEHRAHGSSIFTILSPNDGYGTTSLAINALAAADAPRDKKLYLDLNYRNPLDNRLPFIAGQKGTTDWIGQLDGIEPFIGTDPRLPFLFLCLGTVKEIFPPALPLSRVSDLLDSLRRRFDYIFIDAPPLLISNYSEGLVGLSDVVVVVLEAGQTPWGEIAHTVTLLDRLGTRVVSLVLNRVRIIKGGYFKERMNRFYGERGRTKKGLAWTHASRFKRYREPEQDPEPN